MIVSVISGSSLVDVFHFKLQFITSLSTQNVLKLNINTFINNQFLLDTSAFETINHSMKNRNKIKTWKRNSSYKLHIKHYSLSFFFSTSRFKDIYKSKEKEDVVFYSEILYLKEQNINTQLTKQKIQ